MSRPFEVSLPPVSHCVIGDKELGGRRLFIVGDVHGCLDELQALLTTAGVTDHNAFIICCGDLVNKGPKNCETVEFIRSLGPRAVHSIRGNHDEKVFGVTQIHENYREMSVNPSQTADVNSSYAWVKDLEREDVDYLWTRPYTISVPSFNVIVVHAGLVPGTPLESQRPFDMTMMRGLITADDGSFTATESKAVEPWAALWPGPEHVYFGHNASRGLQRHLHATGLDTGCVYGRQLTGALINSPSDDPVIFSVPAAKVYSIPNI